MNQKTYPKTADASRALTLAGLGLVCLAAPARSQEDTLSQVHELDAYSISASRIEVPIQQVGSSVDLLDSFELSKGEDLFLVDALREIPGLVMRNNGGAGTSFGITTRGLNSNRPTVLLNGIEVSNPSNGQTLNLGNLFTGAVSRVEVLRGPQSSLYGADALAGVISVDTLGGSTGGHAFLGYGSFDTYDYGLGYKGENGALTWSLDGQIHESEGFSAQTPDYGPAWADDDSYDNTTLSGAVQYKLSDNAKVYASAVYLDTYAEFDPGDPAWVWGEPWGDNYATTEQLFTRVGTSFTPAENWETSLNIAYSDVDTLSFSSGSPYFASGKRYKYDWVNTIEASESWSLVAGVEHETEENQSDVGYRDDTSVFVENVFHPLENLSLTAGARYDDNSAYGEETTYRATFSYNIDDADVRLRGSYGTSFQAPTFYQLFNEYYGNADLNPETGKGWDLGVEKVLAEGRVSLGLTLFGNDVNDKIEWDGVYNNVSEYSSEGIEAQARYYVSEDLSLRFAHTYAEAEETGGIEALRVPKNVSSIGVNWLTVEGRLSINANALFVSSQFSDSTARASGLRLEGYEVVNLAGSYELSETYTLWLRIGNLFDSEYEEIAGYQTAGLNVNGGVRLAF